MNDYAIDISKQSLHDRFNEYAVFFLKEALEKLLQKQVVFDLALKENVAFKRILIKDSVCFQIDKSLSERYPGSGGSGSNAAVRVQFEYDLLNGKINDLSINAFNDQDAANSMATIEQTREGDLIIRDLAYMHLSVLQKLIGKGINFLCRANPIVNIYELINGEYEKIDFIQVVKFMKKHNITVMEKDVFLGSKEKLGVRLILHLLPEEEYARRLRNARKNNEKKNRGELSKEYKARATLNLFITNADINLIPTQNVWQLYRLRWQVELIFKIWKSLCHIEKVKKVNRYRLECYIYAKLFFIVLGWQMLWGVGKQMYRLEGKVISFFKAFKTLLRKKMEELREIFFSRKKSLREFISSFYKLSKSKHILEKKQQRSTSFEILINCLETMACP